MDISNCQAPPNFTKKLTPYSMPKGSTWFNTSEIDGKSEYCRGCISRRKSRYGKTALTLHLLRQSIRRVARNLRHGKMVRIPKQGMSPSVYIVARPNGAGKTTLATEFLPNDADCKNFIHADLIAQDMSPFSPEAAAFRAGRPTLEETEGYATRGESFGFETTLSERSYLSIIRRLKKSGYEVQITETTLYHDLIKRYGKL
jgi:hypothetical protein